MMEPSFQTFRGVKLALYERPGDKPALFFIHGNSSSARAFEAVWNQTALQNCHLVSMDLPGHGRSEFAADTSAYTINSLGQILAEIIERKELRDVILIGHSIGGHIALNVLNFTDRVHGVSLAGTVPLNGAQDLGGAYSISDAVQTVFKGDATEDEILAFSTNAVYREEKIESVIQAFKKTDKRFREEMGIELGRHFGSPDFISEIELLKKSDLPVCLVHGEREKVVNFAHLSLLGGFNLFKNKVHVVKDAGHSVPFESPEEYSKILAAFASHVSGMSA